MRWVYFIKPVGLEGPIKIGISIKPLIRLEEFSACSPLPLEMIGFVPGTELDERFMHDCFADHHSHREWYRSSPKLRDAIASALQATRVDVLRGVLSPLKNMRSASQRRRPLTSDRRRFLSYNIRVFRNRAVPADVASIMRAWGSRNETPSPHEIAKVNDFIQRHPATKEDAA
jgi:hypothetical protein